MDGKPLCPHGYRLLITAPLVVAVVLQLPQNSLAEPISELVVFSDSMSDVGNVYSVFHQPPSPPYYYGRYSNGPVWVERLAELLDIPIPTASRLGGRNYSRGGATTGSPSSLPVYNMDQQVQIYLQLNTPQDDQLFVLWGGGNDFNQGQTDVTIPIQFISQHITTLTNNGARQFFVVNMHHAFIPALESFCSRADEFNILLVEALNQLRSNYPITIYEFDIANLIDEITTNPGAFGFSYISESACADCGFGGAGDPYQIAENPDEYILWDNVHFSAHTHQLIGDAAYSMLTTLAADFNQDGDVDSNDLTIWQSSFGIDNGADTDGDDDTDGNDFLRWQLEYGHDNGSAGAVVPEPAPIILILTLTALALASCRIKRNY